MSPPLLYLVDVFAERPYAGNQLAVVLGAEGWTTERMQAFAQETNFSETTFVPAPRLRDGGYDVRIFTPAEELPFAGHPTIGTAWLLRRFVQNGAGETVTLHLGVGDVAVTFDDANGLAWLAPRPPVLGDVRDRDTIAATLGITCGDLDEDLPCQDVSVGIRFVLVPVRSLDVLRALQPARLPQGSSGAATGVLCFAREAYDPGGDLAARMFFEARGLREDPATGSANACLAAYLSAHRVLGAEQVSARVQQGYEIGRPSTLYLRAQSPQHVQVGGRVVLVARGELA
ncbi:MAG TPA: PhzF family phenazine biosynthesis protein [Candidatus Limnocylindrales bacterium]|nr:PhzF family phenazine biosynthesis protein [Candidatus Limnocylindrales bacterium]